METPARNNDQGVNKSLTVKSKKKTVINTKMPDLSNDPYFLKKAESANRLLDKYGTPKKKK